MVGAVCTGSENTHRALLNPARTSPRRRCRDGRGGLARSARGGPMPPPPARCDNGAGEPVQAEAPPALPWRGGPRDAGLAREGASIRPTASRPGPRAARRRQGLSRASPGARTPPASPGCGTRVRQEGAQTTDCVDSEAGGPGRAAL